jgi:hypothetical protein
VSNNQCPNGDGYYATTGCLGFYRCIYTGTVNEQITAITLCPTNQLFDVTYNYCNWASNVVCLSSDTSSTSTTTSTTTITTASTTASTTTSTTTSTSITTSTTTKVTTSTSTKTTTTLPKTSTSTTTTTTAYETTTIPLIVLQQATAALSNIKNKIINPKKCV